VPRERERHDPRRAGTHHPRERRGDGPVRVHHRRQPVDPWLRAESGAGLHSVSEADIYPLHAPDLADQIDGALGEGSRFHETYGYYAQGVGPETATLPAGWMGRVHRVQNAATNDRVGYCLDVVDLFLSKAAAARDKDREFCMALLQHGHVKPAQVLSLVDAMPLDDAQQRRLRATIRRWVKTLRDASDAIDDA
jgi:hypothetical protein